jgi:hypothetical protein
LQVVKNGERFCGVGRRSCPTPLSTSLSLLINSIQKVSIDFKIPPV